MKSIGNKRPTLLLLLALAAGMMFQNIATAQGRRGGMQRGNGKVTQRGGGQSRQQAGRQQVGRQLRPSQGKGQLQRPQQTRPIQNPPISRPGKGSGISRPGAIRPSKGPGASRPASSRPGINRPSKGPGSSRPSSTQPGASRPNKGPGSPRPSSVIPVPGRPSKVPGTIRPGTTRPGTSRPSKGPDVNRPGKIPGSTQPGIRPGKFPGTSQPGIRPGKFPGSAQPGIRPGNNRPNTPAIRPSRLNHGVAVHQRPGNCKPGKKCRPHWAPTPCVVRPNINLCWTYDVWCNYYPTNCYWWYDWCGTDYYFDTTCCNTYNWLFCPVEVVYQGSIQTFSWYLGIECVFIPGRGVGIVDVQAGSPADLAGLAAGMVIIQADGYDVFEQDIMNSIIQESNGLLGLELIVDGDKNIASVEIAMKKLVSSGF